MPPVLKAALLSVTLFAGLSACNRTDPRKTPVHQAWVSLPAVPGRPGAGYFTIEGHGTADRLTRIDSALVRRVELHESMAAGGMMRMRALTGVDVPAEGELVFQPGSYHAMLFGIDPAIAPGTAIPLRFTFGSGHAVEVEAKTVGPGQPKPY